MLFRSGDGVLVEFGSAVEAVRSAVELQRGMSERNVGVTVERRQTFRIGLHLGDIIASDEDVFGDTVNVAARPQTLAVPGSIVQATSRRSSRRATRPLSSSAATPGGFDAAQARWPLPGPWQLSQPTSISSLRPSAS